MNGKFMTLTYSMYTVRHAVTLKWFPIVFVRLIQSQRKTRVHINYKVAHFQLFPINLQSHYRAVKL
jgi:hypothetical protein